MSAEARMPGEPPARPRMTAGLVAFIGLMVGPAIVAFAIVLGAWAVSDEVYAAEAAPSSGAEVAEWKTTLVGICPIH